MDSGGTGGMGHMQVTPDHGSEECRKMLIEAYHRDRARYQKAKKTGDREGCCRYRGSAHRFSQLLQMEYGVEI